MIAQSVVQRTQEIGIRMAIGAQRRDVLALVLASGLKLVALGVVIGLAGAFALTRVLRDAAVRRHRARSARFAGNAACWSLSRCVACAVPALRATRVNPIIALRAE